jgi:hypothetical protein
MTGYFGTPAQQRLQARAEESAEFIRQTPGACQACRMLGCADPERFGWDRIDRILEHDGTIGFRLIPADQTESLQARLSERAFRLDTWDVFVADRGHGLAACEAIVRAGPPADLREIELSDPADDGTRRIQALMAGAGVVPFSGSFLAGRFGAAETVALAQADGTVVAAAHCYRPHNPHSPFSSYAWGGLVAVDQSRRGEGLGRFINARIVVAAFRELGATHIYELVSAANTASRRMIAACGLRHEPGLVCGVASPLDAGRFSR